MDTPEERISFIEGKLDSLATKDDLMKAVMWMAGIHLVGLAAVAAIIQALG